MRRMSPHQVWEAPQYRGVSHYVYCSTFATRQQSPFCPNLRNSARSNRRNRSIILNANPGIFWIDKTGPYLKIFCKAPGVFGSRRHEGPRRTRSAKSTKHETRAGNALCNEPLRVLRASCLSPPSRLRGPNPSPILKTSPPTHKFAPGPILRYLPTPLLFSFCNNAFCLSQVYPGLIAMLPKKMEKIIPVQKSQGLALGKFIRIGAIICGRDQNALL
jgi:hypothetical protein